MTNALNNAIIIIIIIIIIIVISIIDIIGSSGKLLSYLVFYNTFSKNSLYHAIEVGNYHIGAGDNANIMQLNHERIQ